MKKLTSTFFDRDAVQVARELLGKIICHHYSDHLLTAMIIETEAYYLDDKASHASLGFTEKRKALFMPAGTIYMYYARGGDSLNISCQGAGNAVLIKSGIAYPIIESSPQMISIMQTLNPILPTQKIRAREKLCSGQTLLCKSLGLKVRDWDQQQFNDDFYFIDNDYSPQKIITTTRRGIPKGRDEHLPYRFIDAANLKFCSR
ncbi:MAG: DNA-3-methyladenine glycosylase [Legionellales bacterium]|nr:DNA-3-methyladenine glycosylase [Legionellales bacterium]